MTLPSTGSISASQINVELNKSATAPFSLDGTFERILAGKSSGQIAFSDFRGKTYEYLRTLSAGGSDINLQSLFTAAEWSSPVPKRVVLPAGVERGSTNTSQSAVHIGGSGWGGSLTFDVYGVISGAGGGANSGAGGMAFNANLTGSTGQKINLRVFSGGVIRGGGGGGGRGGDGGGGYYTSTSDDNPNNFNHARATSTGSWIRLWWNGWFDFQIRPYQQGWAGRELPFEGLTYWVPDNWWQDGNNQIFVGNRVNVSTNSDGNITGWSHLLWRRITNHHYTGGGAGGNGGRGQGYGQSAAGGSGGGAPGTNAGWGGTGGNGGGYGAWGATGNTGGAGNNGGGAGGAGGGAPGFSIANIGNVSLLNNGTLQGRT